MTFPFSRLSPNDEESLYIMSIISFYVKTDKVGESQRSKRRMCVCVCVYIYIYIYVYIINIYILCSVAAEMDVTSLS